MPRKRFGQHFLHQPDVIARIVDAIHPQPGEHIIEIGPGLGALTLPLLQGLGRLEVVELDRDVIPLLQTRCAGHGELIVHAADALRFDFSPLAAGAKLRLVGNLPYNISTPLLFHLLGQAEHIRDMHFMLQKEVVERMVAAPGSADYGRLTVTLAARARCELLFRVKPGAFLPPPKVDSAVVRILPQPPPFAVRDLAAYDRVTTAAFGKRRKTLANGLKGLLSAEQISAAGLDPRIRAEQLSPAQFAMLANQL
ncbi:MAG: 16S rRNA (adenine(1518)-N(6)/adenine(1519)-N(6))-dimethyltransferase RsmA [Nevskiales bacterium]